MIALILLLGGVGVVLAAIGGGNIVNKRKVEKVAALMLAWGVVFLGFGVWLWVENVHELPGVFGADAAQEGVQPPTTWQGCADAALDKAMAGSHVTSNTKAVLVLNYDLAVCDRAFPEVLP